MIRLAIVMALAAVSLFPYAYAQAEPPEGMPESAPQNDGITLILPKNILLGDHKYYGMLIREDADGPLVASLVSDSDILQVPSSVFITHGKNHGLFEVVPHGEGSVEVTAIADADLYSARTEISYPASDDYRIIMVVPESVSTPSDVTFPLYLVDNYGDPVEAKEDTGVKFAVSGMDMVSDSAVIPEGSASIFVNVKVHGNGSILAYTGEAVSETYEISRTSTSAAVRIGVAPEVILDNSFAYLFIWIANEDDTPISPYLPLSATIKTSNPRVAGFDGLYKIDGTDSAKAHITDGGFHMLKLYTYERGVSTITVSIPGYGAASLDLNVGPLLLEEVVHDSFTLPNGIVLEPSDEEFLKLIIKQRKSNLIGHSTASDIIERYVANMTLPGYDESTQITIENTREIITRYVLGQAESLEPAQITSDTASGDVEEHCTIYEGTDFVSTPRPADETFHGGNPPLKHLCAYVYPEKTTSEAYLIWSLYDSYTEEETDTAGTGIFFNPIHDSKLDFLISSDDSVSYARKHTFQPEGRYTQSNVMPISTSVIGEHTLSITSTDFYTIEASFEAVPPPQYSFLISSLPFSKSGQTEPLFTLSVTDERGSIIDPHYLFGGMSVDMISDDIIFEKDSITIQRPVTIIYGTSAVTQPSITLVSDQNISGVHKTDKSNSLSLSIDSPVRVHSGEQFPLYAYIVDSDERPISLLDTPIDSHCGTGDGILFSCDRDAEMIIIKESVGITHHRIEVFHNSLDDRHIGVDFGDTSDVGLYDNHRVRIVTADDIKWKVETLMKHEIVGDELILTPDNTGKQTVNIVFTSPGYDTHVESREIVVQDKINLEIATRTSDGSAFAADVEIVNMDGSTPVTTPDNISIRRGETTVTFHNTVQTEHAGYILDHIKWNSQIIPGNVFSGVIMRPGEMTAHYHEVINIKVTNGLGTGAYDIGQTVTIRAPPKDVASFLIRDVLDYWTVAPQNHRTDSDVITFVADSSFSTTAVYKQDFAGLVSVVVAVSAAVVAFRKKDVILDMVRKNKDGEEEAQEV